MTDDAQSDREILRNAPLAILRQVAGADAHVDRKEWAALIDAVADAAASGDELVSGVMHDAAASLRDGLNTTAPGRPLEALRAAGAVLARTPGGESLRDALLEIGATVAEASGAQLTFTFAASHGRPGWAASAGTSAVEREALRQAAEALEGA